MTGNRAEESAVGMSTARTAVRLQWVFGVAFLLVLLLGVGARFTQLNRLSLWQDEIHTAIYVNDHPSLWTVIHRVATWDLHSPLYYILLRVQVWIQQSLRVPLTDGNLRILSALLGSLALPAVFLLFNRIYRNRWWALLAMGLAAWNTYGIYYSQELRMYALILLLSPLILYFRLNLWTAAEGRLKGSMAFGYAAGSVCLLYSSLVGLFFVFGVWLGVAAEAWWDRRRHPGRPWEALILGGAILACYLPWLGVLWRQSLELKGGVATGTVIINPRELFKHAFENLTFHAWKLGANYGWMNKILRLLAPLALLNLLDARRRREHGLILLSFLLAFVVYYVMTWNRPFHTGRYFSPWWPFALYFPVAAFSGLNALAEKYRPAWRPLSLVLLALLVAAYGQLQWEQLKHYFSGYEKEDWRRAMPLLTELLEPGDAIVVAGNWQKRNFMYYGIQGPFVFADRCKTQSALKGIKRILFVGGTQPGEDPDLKRIGSWEKFDVIPWPRDARVYVWHVYTCELRPARQTDSDVNRYPGGS